jgi:hypothetical protein
MTRTITQVLIDPMDTKIQLTIVLVKKSKLLDHIKQLSFAHDNKKSIYVTLFSMDGIKRIHCKTS